MAIVFAFSPAVGHCEERVDMAAVTVLADPSLSMVLPRLIRNYSRHNPHASFSVTFDVSDNQVKDIIAGEPGDLFITVNYELVKQLKQQGLADVYTITPLMRNELVLAGPAESRHSLDITESTPIATILRDWEPNLLLAIGDENRLFDGVLAKQALASMAALDTLSPYITTVRNPWQILSMIRTNGAYAILYASQLAKNPDIKRIGTFPASLHDPIVYYAMVVAGENMKEARHFLDYLRTPTTSRIFRDYGFIVD